MNIQLASASKRFNKEWVFRNLSYKFLSGETYAITGNNGSGKSTLLQCICGATALSNGTCTWSDGSFSEETKTSEKIFQQFSIAAPYLEVIEEMTALEFLKFHSSFKPLSKQFSLEEMLTEVQLQNAMQKQIRYYSSGMKQRIKLAMAIFSEVPVLLLDEPCSNFDQAGFDLYKSLIEKYANGRTIIVSSNDTNEYGFCKTIIDIRDYKKLPQKNT
ncbi:ABC transporter ATP-binding protein [Rhizosphaericola mali]|uniref:ABC transporter ATP-binding protein n=1 Tax=Rhizosphaericola mali TaxID=2545455 RepID=A0A5P2G6C9_9BACT|nr:ABC transporter ATP-binding protein [Rhizosphaericola mali]QES90258.1 ABC transporter ATP-binding protein [Rhizosphaericola mali]